MTSFPIGANDNNMLEMLQKLDELSLKQDEFSLKMTLKQDEMSLKQDEFISAMHKDTPFSTTTYCVIGEDAFKLVSDRSEVYDLDEEEKLSIFLEKVLNVSDLDKTPFCDLEINKKESEKVMTQRVTPFLEAVLDDGLVVVNCEEHKWIVTGNSSANYLKPDWFVTHRGFWKDKKKEESQIEGNEGILADWRLRESVIPIEAKMSDKNQCLGELISYMERLDCDLDIKWKSRTGMCVFEGSFWLVSFLGSVPDKIIKCPWNLAGSKQLVQSFLCRSSDWIFVLQSVCEKLDCEVVNGDSFLGAGAFGRVFKAVGKDEREFALKVTLVDILEGEFELLQKLRDNPNVITPLEDSFCVVKCDGKIVGAGYAMELGESVRPVLKESFKDREKIFEALVDLHRSGVAHGGLSLFLLLFFASYYFLCSQMLVFPILFG